MFFLRKWNYCPQKNNDHLQYNQHYHQQQQQHQPATISMCDSRHINNTLNFLQNNINNSKHTDNIEKISTLPGIFTILKNLI